MLELDITEAELLVADCIVELVLDITELELLVTGDVLEILVVTEDTGADDPLEDEVPELLVDVEPCVDEDETGMLLEVELGVLEVPPELLLLDAVLL